MTINAERDEEIDFSEPYFIARGRILVKKSDNSIKGVEDLAGKRVCTALGSTYEDTLKKQAPKAKTRSSTATRSASRRSRTGRSTRSPPTT